MDLIKWQGSYLSETCKCLASVKSAWWVITLFFSVCLVYPLRRNGLRPTLDLMLKSVFDQLCVPFLSALCVCLSQEVFLFIGLFWRMGGYYFGRQDKSCLLEMGRENLMISLKTNLSFSYVSAAPGNVMVSLACNLPGQFGLTRSGSWFPCWFALSWKVPIGPRQLAANHLWNPS